MTEQGALHSALALLAPGTALREGLDRIVRADMGALVVVGDSPSILQICSGGFLLDAPFSPQGLYELAKMDGAIIVSHDLGRIARANVHLVPEPSTPTSETGTRHRTAERVARSLGVPVVSVSEDMRLIALYVGDQKHILEEIPRLLGRTNQTLQTLERYKNQLDDATAALSTLEVEDLATLRDVAIYLQRAELVRRTADELATYIVELGSEARLIQLQLDELTNDLDDQLDAVMFDYVHEAGHQAADAALFNLAKLRDDELLDLPTVAWVIGRSESAEGLDTVVSSRGTRLLQRLPRLPESLVDRVVSRFGTLAEVQGASIDALASVEGVNRELAQQLRDDLTRLTESSILGRFS